MLKRETLCHEVHFRDVFCRPFSFTLAEYKLCVSHPNTYQFSALIVVILFGVDPHGFRDVMPAWEALPIWIAAVVAFMTTSCAVFLLLASFTFRVGKIRVFSWMISLVGFLAATVVVEYLAGIHSDGAYVNNTWQQKCFFALTIIMIETIYFRFVMPPIQMKVAPPKTVGPSEPAGAIKIGPREVRLETLLYIVSEEHYVRVVMRHDKFIHRARLLDLTAQTGPEHGFQPHRSWWISINAKPRIDRSGIKPVLILSDGTTSPIARGRFKETQDWIDAHANWDSHAENQDQTGEPTKHALPR